MTEEVARGPSDGSIPIASGLGSNVRIPIWGSSNLAIEFRPRNWRGESTSALFIQSREGRPFLRLDYGPNVMHGNQVDYHWNQRGTAEHFGISNHQQAGRQGSVAYVTARTFRILGRPLLIVGAVLDGISIVRASDPLRRSVEVAAAWGGAAAGCRTGGGLGARLGLMSGNPLVTAGAGVAGCLIGAFLGYNAAEGAASAIYGWVQGTQFVPGTMHADACVPPSIVGPPGARHYAWQAPPDDFQFGPMR